MEQTPNKKRKMRSTPEQYRLYLEMLEADINFRENKISPDNPTALGNSWDNLVKSLNASGGPQKTLQEWKRVFSDWKCQVRKRARTIQNSNRETGNVGEPEKELTEAEKKLLYLTGNIVIEGIAGVPELGVENQTSIDTAIQVEQIQQNIEIAEKEKATKVTAKANFDILNSINSNLEKLVKLKEREIRIAEIKLQVKYNINLVDE